MKMIKISNLWTLLLMIGFCSCSYLDVVPPEQPDLKDMMKDDVTTLNMLYGCYSYAQNEALLPFYDNADVGGADEVVAPQEWECYSSRVQWNSITPSSINGDSAYPWEILYDGIGYCNLFLHLMELNDPVLNPNDRLQYIAEVKFLKAYYHLRLLQMYGPIPIVDKFMPSDMPKEEFPGRSHFDYCVDYIAGLLDEAAADLPAVHSNSAYYGRATSVICYALKARLYVLAASPLWNGDFYDKSWKNDMYQTPGYGYELVSTEYDEQKWERARLACEYAISEAEASGAALFDVDDSEILRKNQGIGLPYIPGEANDDFKKRVMMFRYLPVTSPEDGNKEIVWGLVNRDKWLDANQNCMSSLPHYVLKNNRNENVGGWGGLSPLLGMVKRFFTVNGKLPAEDPDYASPSDWYESAGLENPDIINLNVGREPRFYASMAFDGDQYSLKAAGGAPLYCEFRNPEKTGYDADLWGTRNYSVTGYLNKKGVHPDFNYTGDGWNNNYSNYIAPLQIIRLGEMYLSLAECEARSGNEDAALNALNKIRKRAGVPEWSSVTLSAAGKTALEAVLDERCSECYLEGYRYYDIRRCLLGQDVMSPDKYIGLDAVRKAPMFDEFNRETPVNQPFGWNNRMYLLPVSNKEVYSNPNMVQAPGY